MTEHEYDSAAASRAQMGALPAGDARKAVLLIQRYRTEAVPSRGGGVGSLRTACDTDLIIRPGGPIEFSPLVLPPVAAKRIIFATRCLVPGGVQAVCLAVESVGAPAQVVMIVTHLLVTNNDFGTPFAIFVFRDRVFAIS